MKTILGRQLKVGSNVRCNFCNRIIPKEKVAYQVREGEAQGVYHGPRCYQGALKHYREMKNKQ